MSGFLRYACVLAASAIAFGWQSPAPQAAKGSIQGQVVNGATGAPLKRAMVRLAGGVDQSAMAGGRGGVRPQLMNKETDEQGRFVFTNLDAGKYRLTAERQGFLRQSYGAHKYSGGSTPVAVGEGQTVKAIDFRLMPQGVIAGKVLDEDGEPMANVQVRAQRAYIRNGRKVWSTLVNSTSSDIGEYRLPELKPGSYLVVASPRINFARISSLVSTEPLPATPEMSYAATFYPSTPDSATAVPVDVGQGGEVRNIDIRLVRTRVFRVRGTLSGMPSGDMARRGGIVPVTLTPRDGAGGQQVLMGQARAPDGAFEIFNVPSGQYLAHAQTQAGGQQYVALAPVDVIGNHVDGLMLRLATGSDVQGSIKLVDAAAPIDLKNVQVMLRPAGFGGQAPRARPGDDLKFTLKSVPPIRYAVTVTGVPDGCYVKSVQYGGADVPDDGVEMTGGGSLDVVLSGAAAQVDLVIETAASKVAAGAQVLLMQDGAPESIRTADENGMLSIKGLKPGSYRLIAWEDVDPDQLWDPGYLSKFEGQGKSVKLDSAAHEAMQLKAIAPD